MVSWSSGGGFLATVNERMPMVVWIWQASDMMLAALLIHHSPVKQLAWDPTSER